MMINRLEQRKILQALIVEDQNVTFIIYIHGTRMNVVLLLIGFLVLPAISRKRYG
jgi:hypothetical protein